MAGRREFLPPIGTPLDGHADPMSILTDIGERVSALGTMDVVGAQGMVGSGGAMFRLPPRTHLHLFEIRGTAPGESENPVWTEAAVNDGSWQPPAGNQKWWWTRAKEVTYWGSDPSPGWKADPNSTTYQVIWQVLPDASEPDTKIGDWVWCILEPWSGRWSVMEIAPSKTPLWGLAQASDDISAGQPITLKSVTLLQPPGASFGEMPPTVAENIFGQEFAYEDAVLILWNDTSQAWDGFKPGSGAAAKILFGKVYTTFTNGWASSNLPVSVKSCAYDGSGVTGDPFNVYTPLIPSKFTRIAVNDIVGYVVDATGNGIIVTDIWSDIMWGKVQTTFTNALGTESYAVSVQTCLYDGTDGTGDAFNVYTPLNPHRLTNIRQFDVVGFVINSDGKAFIMTDIWTETVPVELKGNLARGGNATAYQMKSDGSDADTSAAQLTVYDPTGANLGVGRDSMTTPPGSRGTARYNSQTGHWEVISLHQRAKMIAGTLAAAMQESDESQTISSPVVIDGGILDTSTTITGYNTTNFAGRSGDPCIAVWNESSGHWEFLRAGVPGQLRWFKGTLPGALAATDASIAGVTLYAIDGGPDPSGTVTVYNPKTAKGFVGPSGGVCRVFYTTENSHYEFIDVECV